ncbi:MAG: tripartite tricarboxylate transporter substrate binding protein [Xanthobacteraceae bacterium]
MSRLFVSLLGIITTSLIIIGLAGAQDYPSRPITVIVPMPPGGGLDVIARIVAENLPRALNQAVVVENRGGGNGNIGTRDAARAAPDGYKLLLGQTGSMSINPSLYGTGAGYDPRKDFAPIGLIAAMPTVLMVHPSLPAKSVGELISIAKREPGKLNAGVPTVGSIAYMAAEMFKMMAGVDMAIIPYMGTSPLTNDLLGGHVPIGFNNIAASLSNIQAGNLRALGVASLKRSALLPDVPTVAEAGLPGFEAVVSYGLLAPAGTPRAIIERLNRELNTFLGLPDVRARISDIGGEPLTSTPEEYAADIDREETKWSALVRELSLDSSR